MHLFYYFILLKSQLFFGTIRQSTGPNDQPATPTFLQMYKLSSVYSVIKPPKTGNCPVLNSETPKISIDDVKNIFDNDGNDIKFVVKNSVNSNILNFL